LYLNEFKDTIKYKYNGNLNTPFNHAVGLFNNMEKEAKELGIGDEDIKYVKYALVAFIDEIMKWDSRLGLHFPDINDNLTGKHFFNKLEQLIGSENHRKSVLEVYYICLALGFKGRFTGELPLYQEMIKEYIDDIKDILSILFTVSADFNSGLENEDCIISSELRGKFRENNLSLSDNVSVSKEGKGNRKWQIKDSDKTYIAKKEEKLSVYKINAIPVQDAESSDSQKVVGNQDFLFNISSNLNLIADLNSGDIASVLDSKFQDKGIQISEGIEVSPIQRDFKWSITIDGIEKYIIEKEERINFCRMMAISPNGISQNGPRQKKLPINSRKVLAYATTALIILVLVSIIVFFRINIHNQAADVIGNIKLP
jgi:hypothetical protein